MIKPRHTIVKSLSRHTKQTRHLFISTNYTILNSTINSFFLFWVTILDHLSKSSHFCNKQYTPVLDIIIFCILNSCFLFITKITYLSILCTSHLKDNVFWDDLRCYNGSFIKFMWREQIPKNCPNIVSSTFSIRVSSLGIFWWVLRSLPIHLYCTIFHLNMLMQTPDILLTRLHDRQATIKWTKFNSIHSLSHSLWVYVGVGCLEIIIIVFRREVHNTS